VHDLAGHDLDAIRAAFDEARAVPDRPTVIFAYTIKGWQLPFAGDAANHSALMTTDQITALAPSLGADADDPWAQFDAGSAEAALCHLVRERLTREQPEQRRTPEVPVDVGRKHAGSVSTQQAFGRFFVDLAHAAPDVARHVVTVSPDVASSTNLGGWINRAGIWHLGDRIDWFADDSDTLVHWRETEHGQHIELGIAEGNLVGLLGELGSTWSRDGQPLLPIGTLYDPFVTRALEPWSFGIYAGGQSILVGTPSGVTLAPEGGAHQSIITPSVGIEQPGCIAWEPAFGQDLEWTLLDALAKLGRPGGSSAYFRLTTRPLDQALAQTPESGPERDERRRQVLAGGYRLRDGGGAPDVTLVGVGAVMPEVVAAAEELDAAGVGAEVICLTSPDLIFRALQSRRGLAEGSEAVLDGLFPRERARPLVTALDGHPHTLAFLAAVHGMPIACLGVASFGQSGDVDDLYRHFGIDTETIVGAAIDLLEEAA
jgi:pyruvate dehydrogenase E1 component